MKYIGHFVSKNVLEPDPAKLEKGRDWPRPKTTNEERSFLGFAGYYRKYLKDFAKISRPLADLMPAPNKLKMADDCNIKVDFR